MGTAIWTQNLSPGPADIAAVQWASYGDVKNDGKISTVQGGNGSTFEAPHQRNLKHFERFMS